jgi:hypothetical protein
MPSSSVKVRVPPDWHTARNCRPAVPLTVSLIIAVIYAVLLSVNDFFVESPEPGLEWRRSWLGPSAACVKWSSRDDSASASAGVVRSELAVDVAGSSYLAGSLFDLDKVSLVVRKIDKTGGTVFQSELFSQPRSSADLPLPLYAHRALSSRALSARSRLTGLLGPAAPTASAAAVPPFPANRVLATLTQHVSGVVCALQLGLLNASELPFNGTGGGLRGATDFSSLSLFSSTRGSCQWGSAFTDPNSSTSAANTTCAAPSVQGLPLGFQAFTLVSLRVCDLCRHLFSPTSYTLLPAHLPHRRFLTTLCLTNQRGTGL